MKNRLIRKEAAIYALRGTRLYLCRVTEGGKVSYEIRVYDSRNTLIEKVAVPKSKNPKKTFSEVYFKYRPKARVCRPKEEIGIEYNYDDFKNDLITTWEMDQMLNKENEEWAKKKAASNAHGSYNEILISFRKKDIRRSQNLVPNEHGHLICAFDSRLRSTSVRPHRPNHLSGANIDEISELKKKFDKKIKQWQKADTLDVQDFMLFVALELRFRASKKNGKYFSYYLALYDNGDRYTLRISDHHYDAETERTVGAKHTTALTFSKKETEEWDCFKPDIKTEATEYVYYADKVGKDELIAIAKDIVSFVETGKYTPSIEPDEVHHSPDDSLNCITNILDKFMTTKKTTPKKTAKKSAPKAKKTTTAKKTRKATEKQLEALKKAREVRAEAKKAEQKAAKAKAEAKKTIAKAKATAKKSIKKALTTAKKQVRKTVSKATSSTRKRITKSTKAIIDRTAKSLKKKGLAGEFSELEAVNMLFFYMWNDWCQDECLKIFGNIMGDHFWSKWNLYAGQQNTVMGGFESLWASMTDDNREKLLARAIEVQSKKRHR